jgi:hypothetical protein
MTRKIIDIGVKGNDGTGDPIRDAFRKINDNFQELYTSLGLVQGFTLLNLSDTPDSYFGREKAILVVNDNANAMEFRQITAGTGINVDFDSNPNEIQLSAAFADIVVDQSPQLGGPLSAISGGVINPIGGLIDLRNSNEIASGITDLSTEFSTTPAAFDPNRLAVNKGYADSKIAIAGVDSVKFSGISGQGAVIESPAPEYGIMTGPLVLSRDPITEDDTIWEGKTAATKRYVDGASYFSRINLHVSTTGNDSREDIAREKQGRALAYAFRTIEAACKQAEELMLAAPLELGPYRKTLTYDNGAEFCTLTSIVTSANSGTGCTAIPVLSVDTFELAFGGQGYVVGDIVTLSGGTGTDQAAFRIEAVTLAAGTVTQVRLLKSGVYTAIPGPTFIPTTTNSTFGTGVRFDLTYKITAIQITDGGQDYGLASVRISGGGGSGAFGFVDIVNGEIVSATVTEQGSGFIDEPTVIIELPTFKIDTGGFKTDFTKIQGPSRDIREGLYLRGETSGALANILAHNGTLVGDDELFDVDIVAGSFVLGERISYGDPVKELQITIFVETGIYEENYPIKVPANISIKGDEFRRSIIRPKPGMSTSPYAAVSFRRDIEVDGLTTATQPFGYHYLTDSTERIYPETANRGGFRAARQIISANRKFIQDEVIAWTNAQIAAGNEPFNTNFVYNQELCKRDVGLILDAIAFDLRWGGDNRTISAALKYYQSASALIAITTQLDETVASMEYTKYLVGQCLEGLPPAINYSDTDQVIDPAFIREDGTVNIANNLFDSIIDIVSDDQSFNPPKDNLDMDVFLMNDATILRNITIQGHGGFAMVLDPDGQILTKSPYAQVGTVISGSTGFHRFAGGLLIDGFCGNVEFNPISKDGNFALNVGGLVRKPQTPFSFQVAGIVYRVNYIRNYIADPIGGTAQFVLDETTPYTPVVVGNETFEAITAGNRSMLSNDFTQINDMGYGILATNGGLTEAVGMFTYYCYTAFYALNGAQIRSVGGSSANGVYALKAEGSDPLEVPLILELLNNVSQGATVYAPSTEFETEEGSLAVYVDNYSYVPYNQCQLEVDHAGLVTNYQIINVESGGGTIPAGVAKLNLSTQASSGPFAGALLAAIPDNTPVTIRLGNQIRLDNVASAFGTRPSTALIFDETPNFIYRVNSVTTGGVPAGQAQATLREPYQYVDAQVFATQPASHGNAGDNRIAVGPITASSIPRLVGSQFGWKGTVYTITDYDTPVETGQVWGRITFTPNLVLSVKEFSPGNAYPNPPTLKIGAQAGEQGNITIKISTARFTGHDLLDIGTGSYADTNYPTVIYGSPANSPNQDNEVQEVGKGRVFYVTTDQNGNFRVGPFFSIDQGSGTVEFSADLALSNVDGLGFKRGVTVKEFSTDDSLGDNATDTVPTELAVRSYIDRRLGLSHTNGTIAQASLIPTNTGGFMALNGQLPMKGNMDMGTTNRITALADPVGAQDAVTKTWTRLSNLQDGVLTSVANQDLVMLTGTAGNFVNVANNTTTNTNTPTANGGGSDIRFTRSGNSLTVKLLGGAGSNNPITNFHVNNDAEIAQSKLLMQLAATRSAAPTGTARQKQATTGLASFRSAEFTVTDGFVEYQTATSNSTGVGLNKITWLNGRSIIGNSNVATAAATNILMTDVVDLGGGIKKNQYTTTGYLRRTGVANTNDTDYAVVDEATAATGNTLVKRDSNGDFAARTINVSNLQVDSKIAIDSEAGIGTNTGVIKVYAYRGVGGILLGDGETGTDKVNFYDNDLHEFRTLSGFRGTVKLQTLTTGAVGTNGTLTGNWALSTTSNLTLGTGTIDARTGTLQSLSLTTGSTGTAGTITGAWTLATTSSITLQSGGVIDTTSGSLRSTTLDAGLSNTAATIEGAWSLTTGSTLSPGNGTINATKAGLVTLVATDTASSTHYINFTTAATGDTAIRTDTNLTYNPGTNTLTGVWFEGSFLGNASTVTNGVYTTGDQTIAGIKTFSSAPIVAGLTLGSQTNKATLSYTTNTARTYTIPDAGANANFVMTQGAQTIAGVKTFSSTIEGSISGNAATITSQANSATIAAATANTANTIVLRDVNGNFSAGVMTGTATAARYADLAERYESDKEYKPGTVVIFGGDKEITQSSKYMDKRVAGVISTNPAHLMNSEAGNDQTHPPVALQGRVPCRVVGKIQKGDLLVTSSIPGVAIAADDPKIGTVIGKALENYNDDHIGLIEVVVGRA